MISTFSAKALRRTLRNRLGTVAAALFSFCIVYGAGAGETLARKPRALSVFSVTPRLVLLAAAADSAGEKPVASQAPIDRPTRKKAGLLAAAGLAILSLLVLAAGLALLRAFRQR